MTAAGAQRRRTRNPRILIVTPEITYLPRDMGNMAQHMRAKAGGLADVSASLVAALFGLGADVHVALPHYRRMFHIDVGRLINEELRIYKSVLPDSRIHLAQDRVFFYREQVYSDYHVESHKIALAFQREVINNIVPRVDADLIHCNDWMTGLIPAMARRMGIPCLFTVHNIHTQKTTLEEIEERGIDAFEFWRHLYYAYPPSTYADIRSSNPVDLLTSGIFAAHFVNTVSPTFLEEICEGRHAFVPHTVRRELTEKRNAGCATGILNAPDPVFDPATDKRLECRYSPDLHTTGKRENKRHLQERLGLIRNVEAPMLFWPSRLDPVQKGPQLLAEILYDVISRYWAEQLQLVIVASGPYQQVFHDIVQFHDFHERVAVCEFDEELSHLGYAASDFTLMPSFFEPCGLPQMIAARYGSLPVVHDTGGLHDTIRHLNRENGTGNGFVFRVCDAGGLRWAVDEALRFFRLDADARAVHIARVMRDSAERFNHNVTAGRYFDLYEEMLQRPLVRPDW